MGARRDQSMSDRTRDHYALLGVGRAAGPAELRRAFRTLALRHHPDRAGVASTEIFQRIAEAYAVLSDPMRRARYDNGFPLADRGGAPAQTGVKPGGVHDPAAATDAGQYEGPGGRIGWRRVRVRAVPAGPWLEHLSGSLEGLLARGQAVRAGDGIVDLMVDPETARTGGHAAIDAAASITCPTCGGHAERHVLWCRRCEHAGTIIEQFTFTLELPPQVRAGSVFTFVTDPTGNTPHFRVRVRLV
jgi:molecular chaperone DnaJ